MKFRWLASALTLALFGLAPWVVAQTMPGQNPGAGNNPQNPTTQNPQTQTPQQAPPSQVPTSDPDAGQPKTGDVQNAPKKILPHCRPRMTARSSTTAARPTWMPLATAM